MTYASVSDVTNRLGRPVTADETTMITTLLADVERLIERRFNGAGLTDIATQITAGTVDVNDVIQVEAQAAVRVVRNPDGYISETDGNYTYQLSQGATPGALEVLPEEWQLLGFRRNALIQLVPHVRRIHDWDDPLGQGFW